MQLTSGSSSWIVPLMCGNCRTNCLQSGFPIFGRSAPRLNLSAVSEVIKVGLVCIAIVGTCWRCCKVAARRARGGSPYRLCRWVVRNELELSRVVVRRQAVVCRAAASAGQTVLIPKLRPNSISTYAMLLVVLSLRILVFRWREDLNRFRSNFVNLE